MFDNASCFEFSFFPAEIMKSYPMWCFFNYFGFNCRRTSQEGHLYVSAAEGAWRMKLQTPHLKFPNTSATDGSACVTD